MQSRELFISGHEGVGNLTLAAGGLSALGLLADDFAEGLLVLRDVVAEGEEEVLGVLGAHDDAAHDLGLGHVGSHGDVVKEEFVGAVGDYGEIAVVAAGHLGGELDLELVFLLFHF